MQGRLFRMEPAPDARWMTVEALVDHSGAAFRLRLSAAHGDVHRERWAAGCADDDLESGLLWLRASAAPVELALVVDIDGVTLGCTASLAAGEFERSLTLTPVAAVGAPFESGFCAVEELPWGDHSTDPTQAFEVAAAAFDAAPTAASTDGAGIPADLPRPASDEWDLQNGRLAWWEPLGADIQVVWLDLDGGSGQARVQTAGLDELRILPTGDILCGAGAAAFLVDTVAGDARVIEVNVKAGRRLSAHTTKMRAKRKAKKQGLR